MRLVTFKMPVEYLEMIDILVASGKYTSRSEVIRMAIRDLLVKEGVMYSDGSRARNFPSIEKDKDMKISRVRVEL